MDNRYQGIQISKEDIPVYRFKLTFEICNTLEFDLANKLFMDRFKKTVFPLESSHEIVEFLYHNK